mgnify:FL=1
MKNKQVKVKQSVGDTKLLEWFINNISTTGPGVVAYNEGGNEVKSIREEIRSEEILKVLRSINRLLWGIEFILGMILGVIVGNLFRI